MENIVNRQIEMISVCAADGALTPIRFRMEGIRKIVLCTHILIVGWIFRRSAIRFIVHSASTD